MAIAIANAEAKVARQPKLAAATSFAHDCIQEFRKQDLQAGDQSRTEHRDPRKGFRR